MCIACRKMFEKDQLNRIVRKKDGTVCVDLTGKEEGRGAYICFDEQCINKCKKLKTLNKHLKVIISDDIYQNLKVKNN